MKKWMPLQYIRNYKFNSLFLKNFMLIMLAVYFPLVSLCAAAYLYFADAYMKEVADSRVSTLHRIQETSDMVYRNIVQTGMRLRTERAVGSFLEYCREDWQTYEGIQEIQELAGILSNCASPYLDSVYVYSEKNGYVAMANGIMKLEHMRDISWQTHGQGSDIGWSTCPRVMLNQDGAERKKVLSVICALPYSVTIPKTGRLILNMDMGWFDKLAHSGDGDDQKLFIIDAEGRLLYSGGGEERENWPESFWKENLSEWDGARGVTEDGRYMVHFRESGCSTWEYVFVTDMNRYHQRILFMRSGIILISIFLFVLSMAVSYGISVRVFLPVKSVIQMLDDPEGFFQMQISSDVDRERGNELKYITNSFIKMYSSWDRIQEDLTEHVTKLKQAQVALLQTQINPHFLFNTLQTVSFMAISLTGSDNEVSLAIGELSAMLRQMMKGNAYLCTLREEIAYCHSYIALEKRRYGEKLQVSWNVGEDILDGMFLCMGLQPVLENSIRHGFRNLKCGGRISVEGYRKGERLVLWVKDNGVGQTVEWERRMEQELREFQLFGETHIGLQNVNQRLQMLFGNEYGVHVAECKTGFQVWMEMPWMDEDKGKQTSR